MCAVKLGHASCDEYGRAAGGAAGDQTGKEVCVRDWYAGSWNVLLRPKSAAVAEKMAAFCAAVCANPRVGYDQYQRNTLRAAAQMAGWDAEKIDVGCETDCSAFMTVCAEAAGVKVPYYYGNAPTTWTMRGAFTSTGAFDALTDSRYLVSDRHLRRGDILVRESGHTAMVLTNGENADAGEDGGTAESGAGNGGSGETVHVVSSGETLWGIAERYGTTVAEICMRNGIHSTGFIFPGQKIKIP